MAIAVTPVTGANTTFGNKRIKVLDLVFSGNYATGGESFTAANAGLRKIDAVLPHGPVTNTAGTLANPASYDYTNSKFQLFEGSAAGTAVTEKTNSEAFETGSKLRVTVIGF